jgi:peptide/nickel transport system substrate-binding protein
MDDVQEKTKMKSLTRQTNLLISITAIIVLASTLLAACQPAPAAETTTTEVVAATSIKRGGTLTMGRDSEPLTFDPTIPGDNGSIYMIVQVLETLVRADKIGSGVEPALAESWDISEDGLVYTFHLRDARFSNGSPVTAEDVEYSLTRAAVESGYAFLYEPIDTIETVDDKTVKITLKYLYAPLLSTMSLYVGSIVPKAVHEAAPEAFGDAPIGSGPFIVEEFTRGEQLVLAANPNYWEMGEDGQALPYLQKVVIRYVPESTTRVLGFRNNDFDLMNAVPLSEAESFESLEGVTLEVAPIYRLDYLYINHSKPPLDSREFRLALNYATNREAILENVFFGYGEVPNSYMPKMNFWNADVPLIPYDAAKARELLAQSGYNGEKIDIMSVSGDQMGKQIATMMQQNWAEVGIISEIREVEVGAEWTDLSEGNYMVSVNYITSDINDDDELAMIEVGVGDYNSFFSWYENPAVIDLLQQARETNDPAKRAELYGQIQEIVYYQDAYSIPFNFTPMVNCYYNYVKGWKNLTVGWWWLRYVWLDK